MPSIYDVATAAGVSASTVSRTFNEPHRINQATRKRVIDAAREVNYQPPRERTQLPIRDRAAVTSQTQVVVFQFFSEWHQDTLHQNPFYSQVLAGALTEATKLGMHLVLNTSQRHDTSVKLPRVGGTPFSGMLLVGSAEDAIVDQLATACDNLVFVDQKDHSGRYPSVLSDNFDGARQAVDYLIKLGHRRIGFFTSTDEVDTFRDRLNGYLCAHYWAGLQVDQSMILHHIHNDADSSGEIGRCLTRKDRPTAFFAVNDIHAYALMEFCRRYGLNVPADISIIGFDGTQHGPLSMPGLTSVRVPADALGSIAVSLMSSRIPHPALPDPVTLPSTCLVGVHLVERQSCQSPAE